MSQTHEEMKTWLSTKLSREVTVSKVKVDGQDKFLVDYVNHTAPARKLVADTEEAAIANLFIYLSERELQEEHKVIPSPTVGVD